MIGSITELRRIAVKQILCKQKHEYLLRQALCYKWEASTQFNEMAWTDYRKLYFNFPCLQAQLDKIAKLMTVDPGDRVTAFMGALCHEILHVLWMHADRQEERHPYLWKVACEFAINHYLVELLGPAWIHHLEVMLPSNDMYSGMQDEGYPHTTLGFYEYLEAHFTMKQLTDLGFVVKCAACSRPRPAEKIDMPQAMRNLLTMPENEEKQDVLGFLTHQNQTPQQMPWEMLLMGGLEDAVSQEQSWSVPSRRNELLPGWRHEKLLSFVWILDVSPSIDDDMKKSFMNTVQAGVMLYHDAMHRIIFFGSGIVGDIVVSSGADLSQIEIPYSSGTRLKEVWELLDTDLPEYALVLTDLELAAVPKPKITQVIWGVVGNRRTFTPDYGTIIDLK